MLAPSIVKTRLFAVISSKPIRQKWAAKWFLMYTVSANILWSKILYWQRNMSATVICWRHWGRKAANIAIKCTDYFWAEARRRAHGRIIAISNNRHSKYVSWKIPIIISLRLKLGEFRAFRCHWWRRCRERVRAENTTVAWCGQLSCHHGNHSKF